MGKFPAWPQEIFGLLYQNCFKEMGEIGEKFLAGDEMWWDLHMQLNNSVD